MVRLKNKTRRPAKMLTFNLPHEFACDELECHCEKVQRQTLIQNPRTGERGYAPSEALLPAALTLLAGEVSLPYPDRVKQAPEVAALLAKGELLVLPSGGV